MKVTVAVKVPVDVLQRAQRPDSVPGDALLARTEVWNKPHDPYAEPVLEFVEFIWEWEEE